MRDTKGKGKEVIVEEDCIIIEEEEGREEQHDSGFFEEEDLKTEIVLPPCPSSHAGIISSPVSTPPAKSFLRNLSTSPRKPKYKSRRRLQQKSSVSFLSEPAIDMEIDLDIPAPPLSDFDGISSPVESSKREEENTDFVKVEKVKVKLERNLEMQKEGKRVDLEMSDPIDCASSDIGIGEMRGSPRGLKRRRDTKVGLSRSKVQIISLPVVGGTKRKGKKVVKVEGGGKKVAVKEEKELKSATQLITAGWRDAFMLKPANNKVRLSIPSLSISS